MHKPRPTPPQDIAALADWIDQSEAAVPDLKPRNAKGIVWAGTPRRRTSWAVVYLHGFSASRLETEPLADQVAEQLGANLFYTRLTGHGRTDFQAMGEASLQDWQDDTLEAVQIGQTLGDNVLLISCSTGATLAGWLGTTGHAKQVKAHVLISPNFGPKDRRADWVNAPGGHWLARLLLGPTVGETLTDAREQQAWSIPYPTRAIYPMMALVKQVRESDLSRFKTPVLVFYSAKDALVEPMQTQVAFNRLGSAHKSLERVDYSHSVGQHVLAGAIKDPASVAPMRETILQWLHNLPSGVESNNG